MCESGKRQFDTRAEAGNEMRRVMKSPRYKRDLKGPAGMEVYRCRMCEKFHFGHSKVVIPTRMV